jgi:excisionase family DNA binding protein
MDNTITQEAQNIATKPAVLTVAEACRELRISKWTLYQLIRSRQLETIRIRRRRLIPLTALHDMLNRLSAEDVT